MVWTLVSKINSKYKNDLAVYKDKIHLSPDRVKQLIRRYVTVSNGLEKVWYDIRLNVDSLAILPSQAVATDEVIINRGGQEYRVNVQNFLDLFDKWYYADEAALVLAFPNNIPTPSTRNGWFARLGSTDSVRVRDQDTNSRVDSWSSPLPTQVTNETVIVSATNILSPLANTPISDVSLVVNWLVYTQWTHFTAVGNTLTWTYVAPAWFDILTTGYLVVASYLY